MRRVDVRKSFILLLKQIDNVAREFSGRAQISQLLINWLVQRIGVGVGELCSVLAEHVSVRAGGTIFSATVPEART